MKITKLLVALMVVFGFSACENADEIKEKLQSIEGFEVGNSAMRAELNTTDMALEALKDKPLRPEMECATIDHDSASQTITLNFGTSPCLGADGKKRSGVLEIKYTGTIRNPSNYRQLVFINFKVDTILINGIYTLQPLEIDTDSNLNISIKIEDANLALDNGKSIEFEVDRTWKWTEGRGSKVQTDDVYEVLGTANGVNELGKSFSAEITTALVYKTACWAAGFYYPVSGIATMSEDGKDFEVNYGIGDCDKDVTISKGKLKYTKTLP